MQTDISIPFIYISIAVLLALCTVTLFAVGYPLCCYEYCNWKDSGRLCTAGNDSEGKEPDRPACPGCQQDKYLRGRGPPRSDDRLIWRGLQSPAFVSR